MRKNGKLGLSSAVPNAIGSILGSGILFLPGATVAAAGGVNAVWSWILASILCFALVPLFGYLVKHSDSSRGIAGILEVGLGEAPARGIAILVLGTVCFGMPASALIVGEFLGHIFTTVRWLPTVTAVLMIAIPILANLGGKRSNVRIQGLATLALLICTCVVLGASWSPVSVTAVSLTTVTISQIFNGTLLSFWAFAGFENLAFMSSDFEKPKRDIPLAMLISVIICGLIYVFLANNYASLIGAAEIDSKIGLIQLAAKVPGATFLVPAVAVFALLSVFVNFNSWFWGVSRLASTASKDGVLPAFLGVDSKNGTPKAALISIGLIQCATLSILLISKSSFDWAIRQVSLNFVFIYVLVFSAAFGLTRKRSVKIFSLSSIVLALLIAAFGALILNQGWLVLYPIVLMFGVPLLTRKWSLA